MGPGDVTFKNVTTRLEAAWQSDVIPDLSSFLSVAGLDATTLLKLVKIDQEFRWRRAQDSSRSEGPERLLLEDYSARFPQLRAFEPWPLEMIASEYDVRHRFGDRPSHEEMRQRFPHVAVDLTTRLATLDRQREDQAATLRQNRDTVLSIGSSANLDAIPETIGPYRVQKVLRRDDFGVVYLASDAQHDRKVAIRVPHWQWISTSDHAATYLSEARKAAQLEHPRVVPIYEVGGTPENPCYIVTRFIPGQTLADRLQSKRLSWQEATSLTATLAETLHAAHTRGLVHRDINPANILLDESGEPLLTDFGLAQREPDSGCGPCYTGNPAYTSPEQARGEGHLVDSRSDLFSLGTIFYEMLTAQKPFASLSIDDVSNLSEGTHARPPRQIRDGIPFEIERICLKTISGRASNRYSTGAELAKELRSVLSQESSASRQEKGSVSSSQSQPLREMPNPIGTEAVYRGESSPEYRVRVVPRGLRSFDAADADFFLDLLPGIRDRNGLPESLHFWKTRIEERDSAKTFRVGLMYGPSGCGKSSLLKAGLLPQLSEEILVVSIEATPQETESRLVQMLRRRVLGLPETDELDELLAEIRRHSGPKVLVVLDQFEQWLSSQVPSIDTPLVRALRQCDGSRLQALLMVRDDCFSGVNRLMQQLDIAIDHGQNCAMVDLFDLPHAESVLTRFGIAYRRLPQLPEQPSASQQLFVSHAIQGLAEQERVTAVRLALFAEMVSGEPWEPSTLEHFGGTKDVVSAFLDEAFSNPRSDLRYRRHLPAVCGILHALLPEGDSQIKRAPKSAAELQVAAGYSQRTGDFTALLHILDRELRLITPTEIDERLDSSYEASDAVDSELSLHLPSTDLHTTYYQLTHDVLIPVLRTWLVTRQKETMVGSATLRLKDRGDLYESRRSWWSLPGVSEWLQIRCLTDSRRWTAPEKRVMRDAGRFHLVRSGVLITLLMLGGFFARWDWLKREDASLVATLQAARPDRLVELFQSVDDRGGALDGLLQPLLVAADSEDADPSLRDASIPIRLALVARDPSQIQPLTEELFSGDLTYVEPIRYRLRLYSEQLRSEWLEVLRDPQETSATRFLAALGLVGLDDESSPIKWSDDDLRFIAEELTGSIPDIQRQLRDLLRPIADRLVTPLDVLFDAETATSDQQIGATFALVDYAKSDGERLARLLARANSRQSEILHPEVAVYRSGPVRDVLLALIKEQPDDMLSQQDRVRLGRRRANAAIALLRQGERDLYFDALRVTDDPESLSQFVDRCREWRVTPVELIESLIRSDEIRRRAVGAEKRVEARVMYGLLCALGSYSFDQIPESSREGVLSKLGELYQQDPSAAVHGAAGWLLREWGQDEEVKKLDQVEVAYDDTGEREWFRLCVAIPVNGDELTADSSEAVSVEIAPLTFIVFPAGDYELGSPQFEGGELSRASDETSRVVRLTRPVALCDREMTWSLYDRSDGGRLHQIVDEAGSLALDGDDPVVSNYFDSIAFCRWLTTQYRGDDESWQCYPDLEGLDKDADGLPNLQDLRVDRGGFRLPTEAEWELGSRSGQRTAHVSGGDPVVLLSYGWFSENSGRTLQPTATKMPAVGGLFDSLGNASEWTHDRPGPIDASTMILDPQGDLVSAGRVTRGGSWRDEAASCRLAKRTSQAPLVRGDFLGFRLAMSPSVAPPSEDSQDLESGSANTDFSGDDSREPLSELSPTPEPGR